MLFVYKSNATILASFKKNNQRVWMRFQVLGAFIAVLFTFTGCVEKEVVLYDKPSVAQPQESMQPVEVAKEQTIDFEAFYRDQLVQSALKYINKKDGQDCSGFVSLVNLQNYEPYYSGSELNKYFTNMHRSKAMYNLMKKDGRVVNELSPKIGDLVFFEDTLQKSKRKTGALNITHVGIVTKIDDDNTIHFIHHSNGKNIVDQLNLKYKNSKIVSGKTVNSYMKRCPKNTQEQCLSSNLFTAFASPIVKPIEISQK